MQTETTKFCSGCQRNLLLSAFVPDSRKRLSVTSRCRECRNASQRRNRAKNPEQYRAYRWDRKTVRAYYANNKARCQAYGKAWRQRNRDKVAAAARRRRRENRQHQILSNLRGRLNDALHRGAASKRAGILKMLGCDIPALVQYLEGQFKPGMSWGNYGKGEGKWHIDHIRPCCSFDLTDPIQQADCFHFKNLRPLWESENLSKAWDDRRQSVLREVAK